MRKNEAQEEAIRTTKGHLILVSCPGSGKTTTLVRRIHSIIESGVSPGSILMVTFSKAAALEMLEKYERLFGKNPGVAFQTIHSLSLNLLLREGFYTRDDILAENERFEFLLNEVRQLGQSVGDYWDVTKAIGTEISAIKNNYVDLKEYRPSSCERTSFLQIFSKYETWKNMHHCIDYDDMLIKCKEMLESRPEILDKWASRFRYIQCDEYQDTNCIQRDILYLLSAKNGNLCVVGDDDQSIYRFRGARPEIMLNFRKDFPDAKRITMSTNYRSAAEVVARSDALIKHNRMRYEKEFRSQRGEDGFTGSVKYIRKKGKQEELDELVYLIEAERAEGVDLEEMAILFRTNQQASLVASTLSRGHIPFYSVEPIKSIYEGWIFRDIRTYVELSAGQWTSEHEYQRKLAQVLNRPNRYFSLDMFSGVDYDSRSFRKAVYPLASGEYWRYTAALKAVDEWMSCFGPGKISLKDSPETLVNRLNGAGSIHYYKFLTQTAEFRNQDPEELYAEFDELLNDGKRHDTIEAWFAYADRTIRVIEEENRKKSKDGIILATLHASKGLEWKTVFIIDCNDRVIPHKNSMDTEEGVEEERRLFYVGMTRAKDHLFILNSSSSESPFAKEAGLLTEEEIKKQQAIPKYLPGKKVMHKRFGSGSVVSYGPSNIQIRFDQGGVKLFKFPDVFLDGLLKYV